jgi:Lipid A 3-O-deacylase (PagL)
MTPKWPREILFFSALLFASLAIFAPHASAQRGDYDLAKLSFDSIDGAGPYRRTYHNQKPANCDLVEFSDNSIGVGTPNTNCYGAGSNACPPNGTAPCAKEGNPNCEQAPPESLDNNPGENSNNQPSDKRLRGSKRADFNRDIYYKNKLEFSLDVGWLPINVPFPFDVFEGDPYDLYPLRYTLVPIIASLRWHLDGIGGPLILRGNWDVTFSGSVTAIPRGAETRYFSYDMGIRRNLIPRNWRVAPYWDVRAGMGFIDAKGPLGVYYAQGQNFTFTLNMGSGVRYNFNSRYAITAGLNWTHISDANLASPRYSNYGINVYGPMFGIDIQLRRQKRHSEE